MAINPETGEPTEAQGGAEAPAEAKPAPEMNQSHDVSVGDRVQLNGSLFNVSSGQYDWSCKGPDGETVALTNPTMPGPSFLAEQAGAYVAKLTTDDGEATVTVNASDPDGAAQPTPQTGGGGYTSEAPNIPE